MVDMRAVQYVLHFPKGEKYVSVLKTVEDPEAQRVIAAERERLRGLVHRQMAEAAMLAEPDEGAALLAQQRRARQQQATDLLAIAQARSNIPAAVNGEHMQFPGRGHTRRPA